MDNAIKIYRIGPNHLQIASAVLGRAFENDPVFVALIPDSCQRREKLSVLFKFLIRFGLHYGEVYAPSPQLEGVSIWLHSSRMKMTFLKVIRTGFFDILRYIDRKTLIRARSFGDQLDRIHKHMLKRKHWYLSTIGVDPPFQGKGYGSRMIRYMLHRIDSENLPCYLETNNEKNLAIYTIFGFKVIKQFEVLQQTGWAMLRQETRYLPDRM